jgi:putative ABC transport system permease protein
VIGTALAMIRARKASAVTLFLLSTLAIGAAVAAPVYARLAQRGVAASDAAAATVPERTIMAGTGVEVRAAPGDVDGQATVDAHRRRAFDRTATTALTIPGFSTILVVRIDVAVSTRRSALTDLPGDTGLEFRQGACDQIQVIAGRCTAGPGEVVIGTRTADRHKLTPGSLVHVRSMLMVPTDVGVEWIPNGEVAALTVVGVYRPASGSELYWTAGPGGRLEPMLAERSTISGVDHPGENQLVLAYARPDLFANDSFPQVRADIEAALLRANRASVSTITSIKQLLDRIDVDRAAVAQTPGLAAVPLILLCCFVVFLAAVNTAQARRLEFGMLKLRGSTGPDRVWLGAAEILLPLAAGAVAGYLVGYVGVWLFARATLHVPVRFSIGTEALVPAAVGFAAAVVASLLGIRRDLTTPVADLLRRVPTPTRRWGLVVGQVLAVVLAAAAVVQVRSSSELSGFSVLAPPLVILAVGMVGATVFDAVVERWGRRALRRGRLGLALGLLHLGRRRAGARLLALLVVVVGLVGFAAIAADTANTARREQVSIALGADRVATVRATSMRFLMHAVRSVDPEGSYAMAVMPLRSGRPALPVLALDSPRLGQVAAWSSDPAARLDPAAAMSLLRPKVGRSIEVRGTGLRLRVGFEAGVDGPVAVSAVLAPLDGSSPQARRFPLLRRGVHEYAVGVDCPVGCRLEHMAISHFGVGSIRVTFMALNQTGPDGVLASTDEIATWQDRQAGEIRVEPNAAGLVVSTDQPGFNDGLVGPADVPDVLPGVSSDGDIVVFSPPVPRRNTVAVSTVGWSPVLPRVGSLGGLVDMEYLARTDEPGLTQPAEVWLGPAAPADVLDRLTAAGLVVDDIRDQASGLAAAADRPNSIGVRFLLIMGVLGLVLGAGGLAVAAGVEIDARAEELRSLRTQGLRRRSVARAGRVSYLVVIVAAAVLGAVAAVAAWAATRDRLPLVDVLVVGLDPPAWPGLATLWAWSAAGGLLAAMGIVLAGVLSRRAGRLPQVRTSRREK